MPYFDYKCICGEVRETRGLNPPVCKCGKTMRRVYSPPLIGWNCPGRTVVSNSYRPK